MAQNVSYANNDSILESLLAHILPYVDDKHGDGILNSNFITAILNKKNAKEVVDGGLEFWNPIDVNESSNFKFQGKNDDMLADEQDPTRTLRFPVKVFTGSVTVNDLDTAMNKGRALIKQYLLTKREQAKKTIDNKYNSAIWAASPGANEPESIPSIISITPTTGTIGGLTRSDNAAYQNGAYTTAIADLGSEAGLSSLMYLRAFYSVGQSMADVVVIPVAVWANLAAYLTTMRRFQNDQAMLNIGIRSIDLGDCTIGYENDNVLGGASTITSTYMYGINTEAGGLKVKVLSDGNSKWSTEAERVGRTLNKAFYYKWFGNLTSSCPRANWVATSVA